MNNLLHQIAAVLIVTWLVGLVAFNAGGFIHILLVMAMISILISAIRTRRTM